MNNLLFVCCFVALFLGVAGQSGQVIGCSSFNNSIACTSASQCVWNTAGYCNITAEAAKCDQTVDACLAKNGYPRGQQVPGSQFCKFASTKAMCARNNSCYDANQHYFCSAQELLCGSAVLKCPVGCNVPINSQQCGAKSGCQWNTTLGQCISAEGFHCAKYDSPANCKNDKYCVWKNTACVLGTGCLQYTKQTDCEKDSVCSWDDTLKDCQPKVGCVTAKNQTVCESSSSLCHWVSGKCRVDPKAVSCEKQVEICVADAGYPITATVAPAQMCTWSKTQVNCARRLGCYDASAASKCQVNYASWCFGSDVQPCPVGCAVAFNQPQCNNIPTCSWNGTVCGGGDPCLTKSAPSSCRATSGCVWWNQRCQKSTYCNTVTNQQNCQSNSSCSWVPNVNKCGPKAGTTGCGQYTDVVTCQADSACQYDQLAGQCVTKGQKPQNIQNLDLVNVFLNSLQAQQSSAAWMNMSQFDPNAWLGVAYGNSTTVSQYFKGREAIFNFWNGIKNFKASIVLTNLRVFPSQEPNMFVVNSLATIGGGQAYGLLLTIEFSKTSNLIMGMGVYTNSFFMTALENGAQSQGAPVAIPCYVTTQTKPINLAQVMGGTNAVKVQNADVAGSTLMLGMCNPIGATCNNQNLKANAYYSFAQLVNKDGSCDTTIYDKSTITNWDGSGAPSGTPTNGGVKIMMTSSKASKTLTAYIACNSALKISDGVTVIKMNTGGVTFLQSLCACPGACGWPTLHSGNGDIGGTWANQAAGVMSSFTFDIGQGSFQNLGNLLASGATMTQAPGQIEMAIGQNNPPPTTLSNPRNAITDWRHYWFAKGTFLDKPYFFADPKDSYIWAIGSVSMVLKGGDTANKMDQYNDWVAVGLGLDKNFKITDIQYYFNTGLAQIARRRLTTTTCQGCALIGAYALLDTDACQAKQKEKNCLADYQKNLGNCQAPLIIANAQIKQICSA
eukprot:TRINITY_DN67848_c6_g1_i1.p1 TRINITY_DN67848_c6_g1~~TRINITY_DN67848_c6_g1_i1.p1  ORF type:complete len:953 (+),score=158.51 TRINITY_DN67848_c6_g1_i1:48-2906(+)